MIQNGSSQLCSCFSVELRVLPHLEDLTCFLIWFLGEEAVRFRYPLGKVGAVMRQWLSCICCSFYTYRDLPGACGALESLCCLLLTWAGRDPSQALWPLLTLAPFALTFPFHFLLMGFTQEEGILETATLWQ